MRNSGVTFEGLVDDLKCDLAQGLCQSNGRVVCAWRSTPRPKRPLGRESAPLGQCAGSSLFVDSASDEMALLIEDPMGSG